MLTFESHFKAPNSPHSLPREPNASALWILLCKVSCLNMLMDLKRRVIQRVIFDRQIMNITIFTFLLISTISSCLPRLVYVSTSRIWPLGTLVINRRNC